MADLDGLGWRLVVIASDVTGLFRRAGL